MAMVISQRNKIVTIALLIIIASLIALVITGVIGLWRDRGHNESDPNVPIPKTISSKLQQFTGYTATKHVSKKTKFLHCI